MCAALIVRKFKCLTFIAGVRMLPCGQLRCVVGGCWICVHLDLGVAKKQCSLIATWSGKLGLD